MNKSIVLRAFFLSKGIFLLIKAIEIIPEFSATKASWLWPVMFLEYVPWPGFFLVFIASLSILLNAACTMLPYSVRFKSAELVSSFMFLAACFSFGKIDHGMHGYILSSFFLVLVDGKKEKDLILMRGAVGVFLMTYFLSGLWKLRFFDAEMAKSALSYHIAGAMLANGEVTSSGLYLLGLPEIAQFLLWILVIGFELFGLVVIFTGKFTRLYGLGIIAFHALTWLVMDISFIEAQVLSFILLIILNKKKGPVEGP